MNNEKRTASDVLQGVVDNNTADKITLEEIKFALHERGFGLIMIVFALPLSVPIPMPPGVTAIPSIPLLLFSLQMVWGIDSPWLPKWVSKKSFNRETLAMLVMKASPYLTKVEKLLRPRLTFASSKLGERVVGVFCLVFSVSIAVPLPLTNFIPALGIVLMSLGLISKDGILIVFGMAVGTTGVLITTTILIFGVAVIDFLKGLMPF